MKYQMKHLICCYAEYRDTQYKTLAEFQADIKNHNRSDDYFLSRNANGTYEIASQMYALVFLEDVEDSWHITYKLSSLGKEVVEQLTSSQYVRNEKLNQLII